MLLRAQEDLKNKDAEAARKDKINVQTIKSYEQRIGDLKNSAEGEIERLNGILNELQSKYNKVGSASINLSEERQNLTQQNTSLNSELSQSRRDLYNSFFSRTCG